MSLNGVTPRRFSPRRAKRVLGGVAIAPLPAYGRTPPFGGRNRAEGGIGTPAFGGRKQVLSIRCSALSPSLSPAQGENREHGRNHEDSYFIDPAEMGDDRHHSDSFQISGSKVPGSRPTSANSRTDSVR